MLTTDPKLKACAVCGQMFAPRSTLATVCRQRCAMKKIKAAQQAREERERAERAAFKARKEAAKRIPDLIAEAQIAFNSWIRARDEGLPCICCGKPFEPNKPGGSMDAGHFRSRAAAPNLRFDERNTNGQRKNCNRPGGTTYGAFRVGMIARWGVEVVEALEADNTPHKWRADELREIRDTYRAKLKALKAERDDA